METAPEVIVAEFFSHGAVKSDAGEIVVYTSKELVPRQVLQRGPGDFARIAFQPVTGESSYYVYYGSEDNKQIKGPEWTATSGLLFETRRWKDCDVNSLDSVRQAYASSIRIGSDYVGGVFHRHHPFAPEQGPFLSRYVGVLNAPVKGKYFFYTSSQDCSFLLIDGKQVVAAPGRHPPESRARVNGIVTLEAGQYPFEYFHAATGNETCMVAAWQLPGLDRPAKIAPEMFRFDRVLRIPPTQLEHRDKGFLPDYRLAILGDIPSSEPGEPAMVRTQFLDASADAITVSAKHAWKFGDGQSSEFTSPGHVFLHPGPYRVSLKLQRGGKQPLISNQIYITRQFIVDTKGQEDEDIADYLEMLEQYNSTNLDATGLVQLVRAYVLAEDPVNATQAAAAAFLPGDSGHTDQTRWVIARLVGPVLRDRLDNPQAAAKLWTDATALIKSDRLRVSCAIRAADIFLNDLLQPGDAKSALNFVERHLSDAAPLTRSRYYRVLGDWHSRAGNQTEARSAYSKAETTRELEYNATERTAWQGAHSRSTEAFLRSGELSRARQTLDQWQTDFPADKAAGYLSLLQSRYLYARGKYPQAITAANDLLVVNPRSPYADKLIFMNAKCEEAAGRIPRAIAAHQALITDYPGSPLVDSSKSEIERLSNPKQEENPKATGKAAGKK
jgi:tetratricopeptide (TPR) repeat protein